MYDLWVSRSTKLRPSKSRTQTQYHSSEKITLTPFTHLLMWHRSGYLTDTLPPSTLLTIRHYVKDSSINCFRVVIQQINTPKVWLGRCLHDERLQVLHPFGMVISRSVDWGPHRLSNKQPQCLDVVLLGNNRMNAKPLHRCVWQTQITHL